ncbi:hypothetical protein K502DRAFT_325506 [Neoconidiobolus thromboides FSU 785]|nr:hypothetical protein K502DRAFT_325506 [Neoconidiobolus thromboides FSU 785]
MEKIGELKFVFSQRNIALIVHIFKASGYEGTVSETEEMLPKWFKSNIESIPFKEMWSDDCYWFPYIIEGTPFKGAFYLDGNDEATLLAATLDTLKTNSF